MDLAPETRERIDSLIQSEPVVLFMKGDRRGPQCGFSATVVRILDQLVPHYKTVDVLQDPAIRDGIKLYSSWPTIPQLYVSGEFVGGCDIIQETFASGELQQSLGVSLPEGGNPTLGITDAAREALAGIIETQGQGRDLHLAIDASFQAGLYFGPSEPGELRLESNAIVLVTDPLSATRADGLVIDVEEGADGPAFRIDNPNAPQVKPLTAKELQALVAEGAAFQLIDVRTDEERAKAVIPGGRMLDEALESELEALPRDTRLVFHCHHGGRSQKAAEHFLALGFSDVSNLVGGIDAWAQDVDPSVSRY